MSTTLAMLVSLVSITKYCNALCADSESVAESVATGRAWFASSTTMQVALPLPFKSRIRLDRVFSLSLLDNLSIMLVIAEDSGAEAAGATLSAFVPTRRALTAPPRPEATLFTNCLRFQAHAFLCLLFSTTLLNIALKSSWLGCSLMFTSTIVSLAFASFSISQTVWLRIRVLPRLFPPSRVNLFESIAFLSASKKPSLSTISLLLINSSWSRITLDKYSSTPRPPLLAASQANL